MFRQGMLRVPRPSPAMLVRPTCTLSLRATRPAIRQGTSPLKYVAQFPPRQPVPIVSLLGWRRSSAPLLASSSSTAAAAIADDTTTAEQQQQPTVSYCIVNFYHLVDIDRPHAVVAQHKQWLEDKDVRGRIYISEQGINAQYGGKTEDAVAYAEWLKEQPLWKGLQYSVDLVEDHMFPKLRLKYRPNLISLAGGMQNLPITNPEARATKLPPKEWRNMIEQGKAIVLDVRNSYEWDAGHFVGAARPLEDNFNETPTEATPAEVPDYLSNADPETPVMMYCTGGIRCDVYSTYLRNKGFNNLYTLEGGIQNYMKQEGLDHWNGSLYVFDGRMAVRPNKDEQEELIAAAPCAACGGEAVLPHANCANIDCNKLFIACTNCKIQYKGCCCEPCMDAPRLLRPVKLKGTYGNWTEYASDDDKTVEKIAAGRTRISRRRQRQQALRDKEKIKRADKVERRHMAKQAMAAVEEAAKNQEPSEQRMNKLVELRAQLLNKTAS